MASVNTLCKSVLKCQEHSYKKIVIFTLIRMELNIFVSKQDLINGTRTTAHSAINHALFYDKHSSSIMPRYYEDNS